MFEDPDIAFFKGNGVHNILKRYEFSEEERKVVSAAILTARKERPDSRIIARADALLKEVAQTREPIQNDETPPNEAEILAMFELYKKTHLGDDKPRSSLFSKERRLIWTVLLIVIILALMFAFFKTKLMHG